MDSDKKIQELEQRIADLKSRIEDLVRPGARFQNIDEVQYGLKVKQTLILPVKNVTGAAPCPNIGEICIRSSTDSDLYICNRSNQWEKVGAQ